MQQRLILRGILGAVILLILMLGSVIFWLWTQSPLTVLRAEPEIPEIVGLLPRSTAAMVVLDTPVDQLQDLIQTAAPPPRRRNTRRLQNRLLSPQGPGIFGKVFTVGDLDFRREIQPWLGEELIWAMVPLEDEEETETEAEMGSLLVLSSQDFDRSLLFLNLIWQRQELAGKPLQISTYKGVQIVSVPVSEDPALGQLCGAAFTKDFVIFADQPQVLQQAIDTWQKPELSLRATPVYRNTLTHVRDPRIGWGLIQLQDPLEPVDDKDQVYLQTFGFSLRPSLRGLISETQALWNLPNPQRIPTPQKRDPLITQLPHNTVAFVSGQGLDQLWQTLKRLEPIGGIDLAKTLRVLELSTELNWPQDLFSWMDQEFALALLPSSPEIPDWFMVARVEDKDRAAQQRLDDQVADLGLQILSVPLSNPKWGEAIAWLPESYVPPTDQPQSAPEPEEEPTGSEEAAEMAQRLDPIPQVRTAQVEPQETPEPSSEETPEPTPTPTPDPPEPEPLPALAYHLHYKDHFYLTSSREALETVLKDQPLAGSEVWEQATPFLPERHQGYVFVRVPEVMDWLTQILPEQSAQLDGLQALEDLGLGWPETLTLVTTQISSGLPTAPDQEAPVEQRGQLFIRMGS